MEHRLFAGTDRVYSFQKGRRVYDIRSGAFIQTEQTRPFLKKLPSDEKINYVHQSYYGISQYGKDERFLITPAITVSVGLTLYHRPTQTAALAHLDYRDSWPSVLNIAEHFSNKLRIPANQCTARIIGGQDGYSEELISGIIRALDKSKIPIIEMDVLGKDLYREIIFDSKEGIVYENELDVPEYRALLAQVDATTVRGIEYVVAPYNKSPEGL